MSLSHTNATTGPRLGKANFPEFEPEKRKAGIFHFGSSTSDSPVKSGKSQILLLGLEFEEVAKSDSSTATSDLRARSEKSDFWFLGPGNGELEKTPEAGKVPISYLEMASQTAAGVVLSSYFPFSQLLQISAQEQES